MTNPIRRTLEVLARRGWAKDTFTDEQGRHCMQGALYEAYGVTPLTARGTARPVAAGLAADIALLNAVIEEQHPDRFGAVGVSRFNDHPETTLEDVVTVLEKAAIRRDELVDPD